MKKFNNLEELWNYCSFCPICQNNSREMEVSVVEFEDIIKEYSFIKNKEILEIISEDKFQNTYINKINCLTNKVEMMTFPSEFGYFTIAGACDIHLNRSVSRSHFSLKANVLETSLCCIEHEYFSYLFEDNHILVMFNHNSDKTTISFSKIDKSNRYRISLRISLDYLLDIDFTNEQNMINKLKTILVFH